MHSIIIEPPTIVEPIDQASPQLDLAGWLSGQFPGAAHYENGLAYYRRPMPADAVPVWELGKTQSKVQSG